MKPATGRSHSTASQPTTNSQKILCVDDDESVREMLALILKAKGHAISEACNGMEAMALATVTPFDIVITDHQMPQMTGLELVQQLRAAAFPGKIIVVSGSLTTAIRKKYEALKVDAIASKPLATSEIWALLQTP